MHQPIPRPTKAALAQNKAEDESRRETTGVQKLMGFVKKGPDTTQASRIGEPTLADPPPISANEIVHEQTMATMEPAGGKGLASVEIVKPDQPAAAESTPASATNVPGASPFGKLAANPQPAAPDPNELRPSASADPNELKPTDDQTPPPPVQVNEIAQGQSSSSATASADSSAPASDKEISSSKKKKKKGLKKVVPF
jgi:hypothetical protein